MISAVAEATATAAILVELFFEGNTPFQELSQCLAAAVLKAALVLLLCSVLALATSTAGFARAYTLP